MSDITFLFTDIETTGLPLRPSHSQILEVAAVFTNDEFEQLGEAFCVAIAPAEAIPAWNQWCRDQHLKSGLVADIMQKGQTLYSAAQQFTAWYDAQMKELSLEPKKVQLAGSSVHFDRSFLVQVPGICERLEKLSHRMFDISVLRTAFKIADHYDAVRLKSGSEDVAHRALDDVMYDITQAKVILEAIKKGNNK